METQAQIFLSEENKQKILTIPAYVPEDAKPKRQISQEIYLQNKAKMTGDQVVAYEKMEKFLESEGGGIFLLKGYAGTGKTFVISILIESMLLESKGQIAVTAPTNKAVKVLRKSAVYEHPLINYSTLHKLLGLKESIDAYGRQSFIKDFKNPPKLDQYDYLFVDETSMTPDEIFDMITPFVAMNGLKIIFVGDPPQIPPVGKNDCKPFEEKTQKEFGMEIAELTQIVRQAQDNPIIALTMEVRNNLKAPVSISKRESVLRDNGEGVVFMDGDADSVKFLLETLKVYFASENFRNNADFAHVIAWRNATVEQFNKVIRGFIYGKAEAKANMLFVGEKLIANKPIFEKMEDGKTFSLFTTSDEFEVKEFKVAEMQQLSQILKYYATTVISAEDGKEEIIKIIHEDSHETYAKMLTMLKQNALDHPKGSYPAKRAWEEYFRFMEVFADVAYNYAITAHKSQGSTYDNVFVVEADIDMNNKIVERNRIKYTAFSRPKHKLFIVQ